jgi:hypothetical protein
MWAKREADRLAALELRKIAADLSESQAALAPLLRQADERRKANMRQDGPSGFVMRDGKR